jgi:RNA polymerase-binding transcription factor DksA
MNISTFELKLIEDKKYWQSVMDYMIEPASMDCNSNVHFDVAKTRTALIDRALKRIKSGAFGQCEKCRCQIDPERLETLIESDCHLCARCAESVRAQVIRPPKQHYLRPTPRRSVFAGQSA